MPWLVGKYDSGLQCMLCYQFRAVFLYIKLGFFSIKGVLSEAYVLLANCEVVQFIQLLDDLRAFFWSQPIYFICTHSLQRVYQYCIAMSILG